MNELIVVITIICILLFFFGKKIRFPKEKFSNLFKKDEEGKTKEVFGKVFSVAIQIGALIFFVVVFKLIFPKGSMALWESGVFWWIFFLFLSGFLITKVAKIDFLGVIIMLISIVFAIIVIHSDSKKDDAVAETIKKASEQLQREKEAKKIPEVIWVDFPEKGSTPVKIDIPCGNFLTKAYKGDNLSINYKIITPFGEEILVQNDRNTKHPTKLIGGTYTIVSLENKPGKLCFYNLSCS